MGAAAAPAETTSREESHQRMRRELATIASSRAEWNPFVRDDRLAELRSRAEDLSSSAPLAERVAALADLAFAELRTGTLFKGIEDLESVLELLPESAGNERAQIYFQLGLAHLRAAEEANCREHPSPRSCILPISGDAVHQHNESTLEALRRFRQVLEIIPVKTVEHLATLWLLNIAAQSAGVPLEQLPEELRIPESVFRSSETFPSLPNVAPALGLDVFDHAGGAVVEDLNGDGRLDVLTSTWVPDGALKLMLNQGAGGFVNRTSEAGLDGITGGLNLVHADYDNDGDFDILVLRGAWFGDQGQHPNSLLENDGAGRFRDVTFAVGLGREWYPTQTAAWADYDNDGDLDLYVGNEGSPGKFPAQLFRNRGDGSFSDVAKEAGVENFRFAKGVTWGDYDGDRDPDLFVSNWPEPNRLYRNTGDGTFEDVAPDLGLIEPLASFPTWFWDYDNDGALDLYVANFPYRYGGGLNNLFVVAASYLGILSPAEGARLYRGDGKGAFTEVTTSTGLSRINMPMGANFGDLDGDGFPDFYLGTGYPEYDGLVPNQLYRNDRGERFVDVTTAAGVGHLQKGHGVVFADLDNDGDSDLFEQMGGFYPDDAFHNVLYENPGFGHRWVRVRLVGKFSNRAAVGARLRFRVHEGSSVRDIYRHVGTGGSFGSGPHTQLVGLGSASSLESLEVYWPTSDTTQIFVAIQLDSSIEITEGEDTVRELELPRIDWRPPGRE